MQILTVREVAKSLGVSYFKIANAWCFCAAKMPPKNVKVGTMYYWTVDQLPAIKKALQNVSYARSEKN